MADKKTKASPITYANGFLVGRLVFIDDSEGHEEVVPGLLIRIRVTDVIAYCYNMSYCIEIQVRGVTETYDLWGTIEEMDKVMALDRIQTVV